MACTVEQFGDCGDISTLARALFIQDKDDNTWLSECPVSMSSCGSLLAVGYKNRLCILSAWWISSSQSNKYLISWNGTLSSDISAVLALPLCPTQTSSQNGPDWFCIVVGFKTGAVGFYTHTGHLLFTEKFEDKSVLKLSCHTGTYGTLADDVHVLYQNCQCIVSGATLFPTLRNAKAQLARVQAGVLSDYSVDSRSVGVKKWTFQEQEVISDASVVGLELKNTYDHLLAASCYGGYDTWYRSIPPANTLILTAGAKPYVGFHYALEGGSAPPLQDVARAVANKIKSALPGWLGGGSSDTTLAATEPLRGEPLSMRAGLHDGRQGTLLALSPDRRLAAVSDSAGRVAVLDVSRGYLVRLFKGCRDAQCAFLQVFEQDTKKPQLSTIKEVRRALFLIIYTPKKGLVDIRLMLRGTRVAAFTATKNGTLIYNTCGLVGAEQNFTNKRLNLPEVQCVLLDPDGKLKRFNIPFFFALEGENSERSKDLHILRELRDYLKRTMKNDYDIEVIVNKAAELRTLDLMKHCIEMLVRNYSVPPDMVMECTRIFWYNISETHNDEEKIKIKNYFANLALVTLFYQRINNNDITKMDELLRLIQNELNLVVESKLGDDDKELNLKLLVDDDCILERLLILAQEKDYKELQHARVTFADNIQNSYKDFLSSFSLENSCKNITLKPDLSVEKTSNLASYIFKLIFKIEDQTQLTTFIKESNVDTKEIVRLLMTHVMNMDIDDINLELIEKLIRVLYYLCRSSEEAMKITYNEVSEWWQSIRDVLVDMPCPLRSMIVAMACKAVAQNFETAIEDKHWESVTKENAKWGILIGKLEDISILSIILHIKETYNGKTLPKLYSEEFNINLRLIYSKGKGSVTELIAKWLSSMGVPPEAILANELMDQATEALPVDTDDDSNALFLEDHREMVDDNPRVFKWLSLLRQQFPLSTSSDYIMVNLCWEYAISWQRTPKELDKLIAVVSCVKNILDAHIRLGVCSLIWLTYIKQIFESSCRLINKVGKLPKEILCIQDVGFSDTQLVKFLQITTEYLRIFFENSNKVLDKELNKVQFEKIWDESKPSLIEVALDAKQVNADILNVTYQISMTIYYQCHFNIKVTKPLNNLFDIDYHFVFENLTKTSNRPLNLRPSEKLKGPRLKFISKIIRGAIESISCTNEEPEPCYDTKEYADWMEKVQLLADLWCVDGDVIKRQQLLGLYQCGFDSMAEECLPTVRELGGTLATLAAVTAQRLKRSLETSDDPAEWLAAAQPQLSRVVEMQEINTAVSTNAPLDTAVSFLRKVLSFRDRISAEYEQDIQLLELIYRGCQTITELKL